MYIVTDCGPLPGIPNGDLTFVDNECIHDIAYLCCDTGYNASHEKIECTQGARWSGASCTLIGNNISILITSTEYSNCSESMCILNEVMRTFASGTICSESMCILNEVMRTFASGTIVWALLYSPSWIH
jgi:hypothetical protein